MRICHFTATGFDHEYFRNITIGLTARGHTVLLATLGRYPEPSWVARTPSVEYSCLKVSRRTAYPWAILKLAAILRRGRVEVCHAHLFDGGAVGISAARLSRRPTVVLGRHHLDPHQMLGKPVHTGIDRWMSRSADCTVVPSDAVREHMRSVEGLTDVPIEVIRYGFDFSLLERTAQRGPAVRELLGLQSSFVIGYTGRLVVDKGLGDLFEAAQQLSARLPELKVLLVGAAPDDWMTAVIEEQGLSDVIVPVGFQPDPAAYMAAMDVAVHPSLSDSLPQAVIEAMAVGTPMLATRVGGIPEIVDDGMTGLLVSPGDPVELAEAILRLYRDPVLREKLASRGQQYVHTSFRIERMVTQLIETYSALRGQIE